MKKYIIPVFLTIIFLSGCDEAEINSTVMPPRIILNGHSSDTAYVMATYNDPGARIIYYGDVIPNCNNGAIVSEITGTVNTNLPGVYFINYNASDSIGNPLSTVTRTVHVIENSAAFLNGTYNVLCSCTAAVKGVPDPTVTLTNYTATISSSQTNAHFDLNMLKVSSEYVLPFPAPSIKGNSITIGFWDRNFVPGTCGSTGTLSPTKNTFTIESVAYQFFPAMKYNCRNIFSRQLVIN